MQRARPANGKAAPSLAGSKVHAHAMGGIRETLPMPFILQQPEEQTDNWDDDFEEGISLTKLQGKYLLHHLMSSCPSSYSDVNGFNSARETVDGGRGRGREQA